MRKADLRGAPPSSPELEAAHPAETGRYIVLFRDGATEKGIELLESLNLRLAVSPDAGAAVLKEDEAGDADVIVYPQLGVAVLAADPEQVKLLSEAALDSSSPILAIEPEKVRSIIKDSASHPVAGRVLTSNLTLFASRLREDFRSTTNLEDGLSFSDRLTLGIGMRASVTLFDESQATWGLQRTNVVSSQFSGRGIRVGILDTGIDLSVDADGQVHYHPDFEGRNILAEPFVPGARMVKDGNGHGTHCLGIACGPRSPATLPRYGIAYESDISVAKVADDAGRAADGWIMAGIIWAIATGCQIISISLGRRKEVGQPFNVVYENIALRALDAGVLVVAAAGDCFDDLPLPVEGPADCPSIMAVGAITEESNVASFSCAGINVNGGEVDIAAPGTHVHSSYRSKGHTRLSGTSQAAPYVAGIAALYAEANPGVVGKALWDLLIKPRNVSRLPFSSTLVGAGLVQAP